MYEALVATGATDIRIVIPPKKTAIVDSRARGPWCQRNDAIERIGKVNRQTRCASSFLWLGTRSHHSVALPGEGMRDARKVLRGRPRLSDRAGDDRITGTQTPELQRKITLATGRWRNNLSIRTTPLFRARFPTPKNITINALYNCL